MIFLTDEHRTRVGSTYTNIYSSASESESSSGESGSEDSGDDGSDWEGSQGSQETSDSEEETGKEEDKEIVPGTTSQSSLMLMSCYYH